MPEGATKNGWTRVAFGDVVRQVRDRVDPEESGLERYVAGEHMDTDDLRIRRWGLIGDGYLGPAFHMRFKPGHVLYGSRRTYLRKVAVADFEGITANTTFVIESKAPTVLLPELLPFLMQTESFHEHSIKQSKGSVNPYINFSDLTWYEFALPPLEEQRRIAALLITLNAYQASMSDSLEESGRLMCALQAWAFEKNQVTRVALGDVAEVTMGRQRSPKHRTGDHMVPYLRAANAKDGYLDLTDVLTMNFTPAEQVTFALVPGDILVTEGCGSLNQIGANAVWNADLPGTVCFQNTLIRLRAIGKSTPSFLKHWARFAFRSGLFARVASGTSVFHIGSTRAKQIEVALPNLEEQGRITQTLDTCEATSNLIRLRIDLLRAFVEDRREALLGKVAE